MATAIPMAKDMSEQEIQELLEDRKNGMGLQKAAKKYGIGVPRLRRLEQDNGIETTVARRAPQLSIEDIQKHFQEVQESFAIVLDELQATREELRELRDKPHAEEDVEVLEEMQEEVLEDLEDVEKKVGWQMENSTLFAIAGLALAGITLLGQEKPARPIHYYVPPAKKSKIPEME